MIDYYTTAMLDEIENIATYTHTDGSPYTKDSAGNVLKNRSLAFDQST